MSRCRVLVVCLVVGGVGAVASCGGGDAPRIIAELRARPGSTLADGIADGFTTGPRGISPHFSNVAESRIARLVFPAVGNGRIHLEDEQTGMTIAFLLRDARAVEGKTGDGYVAYPGADASGATVLHRAMPDGTEDFVAFERRPARAEVKYEMTLGHNVAGLRLVEQTLEMLDDTGTPRLRIAPPSIVGADGARTDASLAVEGCDVDTSSEAPWGREIKPPQADACLIRVAWNDEHVTYPAVLDPRWTTTGSMTVARQDHTAIALSTGKVLVAGGRSTPTSTTGLASAELYDRTTGTWAATASMTGGRYFHTASQLGSTASSTTTGKVLIAGGLNGTTSVNTAQLYSVSAGTWVAATNLNAARHGQTATVLSNGKVLLAGGLNGTTVLNTAAQYDPSSGAGTWTATGNMPQAVKFHTATLLQVSSNSTLNNKVLVTGGNSGTASVANVQLFDGTSTWSSLSALSSTREGHVATALANGNVLITGGRSGSTALNTTLLFNAASGSGSWSSAGTLTSARQAHTATLLPAALVKSGQVLVAAGSNGTAALSSAELWNGTTTWTLTSALGSAVQGHTATLLPNNMVLIAGGLSGSTTRSLAALYDASFSLACTSSSQCATGFCVNGVCCDTACTGTCGACNLTGKVGTCSPVAAGTVCRAANGVCDAAETCNGTGLTCPADGFKAAGTICRPVAGPCDSAESCGGTSSSCPADAFAAAGTVCRPAANACDVAETCAGNTTACPANGFAPAGTACNDGNPNTDIDKCNATDSCIGTGDPTTVFGFEKLGRWSFSTGGTVVGLNQNHTQGTASLEVAAQNYQPLTSEPMSSIGTVGPVVLLDILLPTLQGNPNWFGDVQMFVNAPSVGIFNQSLGDVQLTGLPLATWQTLAFQLTSQEISQLSGSFNDLTFTIALNVSFNETGHYLLDNLRFVQPITPVLQGIAKDSNGNTKAIFTYQMSGSSVDIQYGPANALSDDGGFIAAPVERPPQHFAAPGGSFVATLTGSQLTWTVGGQSVTATPGSPLLSTTTLADGTPVVLLADGSPIPLDPTPPELVNAIVASDTSYTTIDQARDSVLGAASQAPGPGLPPLWQKSPPQVGATSAGTLPGNFQVTDDGAAEYVIPLDLPHGRHGVEPILALAYNSRGGNGAYGPGWTLRGISQITRCNTSFAAANDHGQDPAAVTFSDSDTFCVNGQELIAVGTDGFRTKRDDFTRYTITASDGLGPTTFKAERKDGFIDEFGVDSSSRGETIRGLPGSQTTVRYGWGLSRRTDRYGNEMDIDYLHTPDGRAPNIKTPIAIRYTSNPGTGRVATNTVTFKYQSIPFLSVPSHFMAGAVMSFNDDLRVTSIQVSAPNPITASLVAAYNLTYSAPSITGRPLLTRVQRCDGAGVCVQPTTFSWDTGSYDFGGSDTQVDDFHDGNVTYDNITRGAEYAEAATRTLVVGDFNADGRDDLLYRTMVDPKTIGDNQVASIDPTALKGFITWTTGQVAHLATQFPNIHFPVQKINPSDIYGANNITPTPVVGDWNGDGFSDVILPYYNQGFLRNDFYQSTGTSLAFQLLPSGPESDGNQTLGFTTPILADFDGDGLLDVARELTIGIQGVFGARMNTGGALGNTYAQLPNGLGVWSSYCAPTTCINPAQLVTLDLDGDGRTEVVMSSTDMGGSYGIQAGAGGLTTVPATLPGKKTVVRPLDFNGDRLTDFLAQKGDSTDGTPNVVELWENTGNGFVNLGTPSVVDSAGNSTSLPRSDFMLHSSFVADFNGDGLEDVLMMSCQLDGPPGPPILYLSKGTGSFVQLALSSIPSPVQISVQPSSSQPHPLPVCPSAVMDVDGDGQKDILQSENGKKALRSYTRPVSRVDHLTHVRNGVESTVSIQYSNYSPPLTETCAYPYACNRRNVEIVSGYSLDNGVPEAGVTDPLRGIHYTMTYSGVRVDARGAGLLGFDSIVSRNDTTGVGYTRKYDLVTRVGNWYPYAGLPTFVQTDAVISQGALAGYHVYRFRSTAFEKLQSDPTNTVGPYAVQPHIVEEAQYEVPPNPDPQVPANTYRVRQTDYTYTYDGFGNVKTSDKKDLTNADEFTQYDVSNDSMKWLLGQVNAITITSTSASGEVDTSQTTFGIDQNTGAVTGKTTDPNDPQMELSVTYHRNGDGLIDTITEAPIVGVTRVSTIDYDTITGAWPATLTNPLHQPTRLVYHCGLGVLVSSQDPNDVYTFQRQFDGFGRLRSETEGTGLATSYNYARVAFLFGEPVGGPITIQPGMQTTWTDSTARSGSFRYDSLGRELNRNETAFDGLNRITVARGYDPATGQVSSVTEPFGASTGVFSAAFSMTYDEFGRMTSTKMPSGSVLTRQYSGTSQSDLLDGTLKRSQRDDSTGKMINTTTYEPTSPSPGGQVATTYDYGPFGTLRHVHLPGGSTVTMTYDHMARRTGLTDPDAGNRITHYNPFGEVVREELPGQADVIYSRDDLGRVFQITQGTSTTTYQWDFAEHGIGKLDFELSPSGVKKSYMYYPNGLTQTTTSVVDGQIFVFDKTYDPAGRLQTITYPDIGAPTRYAVTLGYGSDGRVATAQSPAGDFLWQKAATAPNGMTSLEVFGQAISATHDYDPTTGLLKHIAAGNGTVTTEQDGGHTFTNAIQSLGYTYFPDGKLQGRTDFGLGAAEGFTYDNTDRVTHWTTPSTGTEVQYHYDDLGNLTERDATGAAAEIYRYGENNAGPHALTTGPLGTYSYDPSGRQSARPAQPELSYTYFDLPTAVQRADGTSVTFEYDAEGTRVVKSAPSGTVTSIEGLYEKRVQGNTTTHVFYLPGDGTVVGQIECPPGGSSPGGTYQPPEFVHPDRLGTVDTVSSNGAAAGKEKRDPYGRSYNPANMSGVAPSITLGFIGAGEDSETGLINLNHRLYDAQLGRFISTDPLVKDPLDSQEYNRYAYGSNNPLSFTDPMGLQSGPPTGAPPDQGPYNPPPPPPPPSLGERCSTTNGIVTCVSTTWDGRSVPDAIKMAAAAAAASAAAAKAAASNVKNPFQNNPFGNPNAPPNSLPPGGTQMPGVPTFNSPPSPSQAQAGDYIVHMRRFAEPSSFGMGFHGDARKPSASTERSVTSRVAGSFSIDSKGKLRLLDVHSDPSRWVVGGTRTASPSATLTQIGGVIVFTTAGSLPLIPGAPDIDTRLDLSVRPALSGMEFTGTLQGDPFPSAEVFVVDPSGKATMLGSYSTPLNTVLGPGLFLFGTGDVPLTSFSKTVSPTRP